MIAVRGNCQHEGCRCAHPYKTTKTFPEFCECGHELVNHGVTCVVTHPLAESIQATREGGGVERLHIVPHAHRYTVAQHSFGALNLLLLLHNNPSLNLIKAVQWHDVAERWTGDVPATAKWMRPGLRAGLEHLEQDVMKRFGLVVPLTEGEGYWLATVDILDLWLWCREHQQESPHMKRIYETCCKYITDKWLASKFPWEAWELFKQLVSEPFKPLPDMLDGLGEAST